jgi:hypothetical protein
MDKVALVAICTLIAHEQDAIDRHSYALADGRSTRFGQEYHDAAILRRDELIAELRSGITAPILAETASVAQGGSEWLALENIKNICR